MVMIRWKVTASNWCVAFEEGILLAAVAVSALSSCASKSGKKKVSAAKY